MSGSAITRAAEAKERANRTHDPKAKADFLNIERIWLRLARSFEFGERLGDFTRENTHRAKPAPVIVPPVSHRQAPVNILVVDDEPKNLTVLEAILDDADYRLVRAHSAEQALLALLAQEFALLILDIRMPGVTGFELAQTIKRRKKTAHVPIIFLTAYYGEDHHIIAGYGSGAVDYVTKPVNPDILRSKVGAFADIYRKQRNLEDVNRRLAAVVDSSDDAIISKDLNGIIATFNEGAERLFGYMADEVVGKPINILIPTDRQHEEPEIIARIRRGERIAHHETVRRRKDGTLVDISLTVSPVKDDQGKIIGASKIARDITERKLIEARLREKEQAAQRLAAVVESSDDAIISKDLNGIIATFNEGAERLFGYKAEDVIGKPVTILFPSDRQHEEPEILDRIRRGERVHHYDTVRRRKDGTLVDVSLTVSPVKDDQGRIIGASKIARDITERKLSEIRLRDSEQRLQELIAAIPAAIYTTDSQGKFTYFNEAAAELAGSTPTIGCEWWVTCKLYRPDGTLLPHDQYPIAVALREGRAVRNAEVVVERPDGTRIPIIPYPTPLRDITGKVVGAISILVDVSERKQAETQQRILLNELNHRVKNNMQMLQILLEAGAQRARSPEAREVLDEASSRIMAMAAAQGVLYTTHDATQFNTLDFLSTVCETAKQTFPQELDIDYEGDAVQLSNDAAMPLALIANELLTNAVKYGRMSGRAGGTIRVRLRRENDSFLFYVEDDGPGFDLESVQRRSSGLRLVQGLARQLGGTFEVIRTPGTRCSVRF